MFFVRINNFIAVRSRPILSKSDGSTIPASELWSSDWSRKILYVGRNPSNVLRLEKRIHEKINYLPLGRRLNRNIGGWKARNENLQRKFVVGVTYNLKGYGMYKLNK